MSARHRCCPLHQGAGMWGGRKEPKGGLPAWAGQGKRDSYIVLNRMAPIKPREVLPCVTLRYS